MMKILFGMRDDGDMTEPMNIMLLSALAKRLGHTTDLWVMERDDLEDTLRRVKPDVVAFSCITGSHRYYIEAGKKIKSINPCTLTVYGGPHFTFFPGEIFKHNSIDVICVGEGDDAWLKILTAIENNEPLEKIHNVVTSKNARLVLEAPQSSLVKLGALPSEESGLTHFDRYSLSKTHLRERETNLDNLPFMDRGLIYDNTEFLHRYKRTLMASRGCPFRCTYCFEHQWNALYQGVGKGQSSRIRQWYSVDRFLDELEYIKTNWDTRFFKFYDDVMMPFPNDAEIAWHQEFCSKYPQRIGLPFHLLTRCDLVATLLDKGIDVVADWKRIGMASFTMSIESGNPFIRDHVIIRDMSAQDINRAFKHSWDVGVYTFPNVILGIPAPLIPLSPNDPNFDLKLARVGEEIKILQKLNGRKIDLDQVTAISKSWFLDDADRKAYILDFLKSVGLRSTNLEYDKESVRFTLKQRPGFPEFPILAPFPKTKATDWTIARGDFDGDFDKLHASYQHLSALTCYGKHEKSVQQNLALLGGFLALFAGSRNSVLRLIGRPLQYLCIRWLSEIDHSWATKFYGWLYSISKAYMHKSRIYPIKYSLREKFNFYTQMFALDFWKQFRKKKLYRADRPGQTLGGPASL